MPASPKPDPTLPAFELARRFQAPLDRVWRAWTDAGQFAAWWGPKGCSVVVPQFDFRPGGFVHYRMDMPDGPPMWGRFVLRELAPQQRVAWLNSFSNPDCGIARAPFSDLCPLEIENTVAFSEEAGATLLKLRAVPWGASVEEQGFFAELCSSGSLAQGYGGTFDQLEEVLRI